MKHLFLTLHLFALASCIAEAQPLRFTGQAVRRELVTFGSFRCASNTPDLTELPRVVTPLSLTATSVSLDLARFNTCPAARFASATISFSDNLVGGNIIVTGNNDPVIPPTPTLISPPAFSASSTVTATGAWQVAPADSTAQVTFMVLANSGNSTSCTTSETVTVQHRRTDPLPPITARATCGVPSLGSALSVVRDSRDRVIEFENSAGHGGRLDWSSNLAFGTARIIFSVTTYYKFTVDDCPPACEANSISLDKVLPTANENILQWRISFHPFSVRVSTPTTGPTRPGSTLR